MMEDTVSEAPIAVSEKGHDLDGFIFTDYVEYFPEGTLPFLTKLFTEKNYGWMSRARAVLAIAEAVEHAQNLKDDLSEKCTGIRTRKVLSLDDRVRSDLRKWIEARNEDELRALASARNVSYTSFMASNDKVGLIEAIIDETLTV